MKKSIRVDPVILERVKSHVKKTKQSVSGFYDLAAKSSLKSGLSSTEAVYGFAGWLTTRKEKTVMSSSDNAAPIAELVHEFCKRNKLPDCRPHWEKKLIPPTKKEQP